jgi:hypothetical protein
MTLYLYYLCGRKCVFWKIWWGRRGDKALQNFDIGVIIMMYLWKLIAEGWSL